MLREGPIPHALHGLLEYIAGIALIATPLLLDYDSGAATAASIILGVVILFLAAATASPVSLIGQVPAALHLVLDYVLVVILIASPFLFGFSDESTPTVIFIGLGVVHLLVTIGTRFTKPPPGGESSGGRKRPPREVATPPADDAPAARPASSLEPPPSSLEPPPSRDR